MGLFLFGCSGGGAGTQTVFPRPMVFDSDTDGDNEVFVRNGSLVSKLTNNSAFDGFASFSYDDSKIVFETDRDGNEEIYTMNANGTSPTNVSNNSAQDYNPRFSPDGTKIVFESYRDDAAGEIYIMNSNGTGVTRLTNNSVFDGEPYFSPDGTKILFTRSTTFGNHPAARLKNRRPGGGTADGGTSQLQLYTMDTSGNNVTLISDTLGSDGQGHYNATGTKIVFTSDRANGGDSDIYSMNADGTNVTRLTTNAASDYEPTWTPDGAAIVFTSERQGNADLYIMLANGTNQQALLGSSENEYHAAFGGN